MRAFQCHESQGLTGHRRPIDAISDRGGGSLAEGVGQNPRAQNLYSTPPLSIFYFLVIDASDQ